MRFLDEAGVYTTAPTMSCWRMPQQPLQVPKNGKGSKINLIGSVNYATGQTEYRVHKTNIDSWVVLGYLQELAKRAKHLKKKIVVCMDNASWHTSGLIFENLQALSKMGLFVGWLPTYSPHLNLMETVWRVLKYHLLPRRAYDGLVELEADVLAVMDDICIKGVRV